MMPVRQRHRASCGATVAAIVADVSLDLAEEVNGIGSTNGTKLRRTLASLGVRCGRRLVRVTARRRPAAGDIVRIKWRTKGGHWSIALAGGRYLCTIAGVVGARHFARRGGAVVSFLPVMGRGGAGTGERGDRRAKRVDRSTGGKNGRATGGTVFALEALPDADQARAR